MTYELSWRPVLMLAIALDAGVVLFEVSRPEGYAYDHGLIMQNAVSEPLAPPIDIPSEVPRNTSHF